MSQKMSVNMYVCLDFLVFLSKLYMYVTEDECKYVCVFRYSGVSVKAVQMSQKMSVNMYVCLDFLVFLSKLYMYVTEDECK